MKALLLAAALLLGGCCGHTHGGGNASSAVTYRTQSGYVHQERRYEERRFVGVAERGPYAYARPGRPIPPPNGPRAGGHYHREVRCVQLNRVAQRCYTEFY